MFVPACCAIRCCHLQLTDDLGISRSQVAALELSAKESAAAMEAMIADKNVVVVAKTELENQVCQGVLGDELFKQQ